MTTRTKSLLILAVVLAVLAACFSLGRPNIAGVQTQSQLVAHYGNPTEVTNDIKLPTGLLETFVAGSTTIKAHVLNGECYYITYYQPTNWASEIFSALGHNGESWSAMVPADSQKAFSFDIYPTVITNKSNLLLYRSSNGNGATYNRTNFTLEVFSKALLESHP